MEFDYWLKKNENKIILHQNINILYSKDEYKKQLLDSIFKCTFIIKFIQENKLIKWKKNLYNFFLIVNNIFYHWNKIIVI